MPRRFAAMVGSKKVGATLGLIGATLILLASCGAVYSSSHEGGEAGATTVSSAGTSASGGTVQISSSTGGVSTSGGQSVASSVNGDASSNRSNVVDGSGNPRSEARQVSGFDQVALDGIGRLVLSQGGQDQLTIDGDDNVLPELTSEVHGGVLHLRIRDGVTIRPSVPIVYHLTMRQIAGIAQAGLATIEAGSIHSDHLNLDVGGSGTLRVDQLQANSVHVVMGGSGSLQLAGNVPDEDVQVMGVGNYRGDQLASRHARLAIQGSGNCAVRVADSLDASVVGSGNITYAGAPSSVTRQVVGVGTIAPA